MKAPAKINLLLRVLSLREDGRHNIESVMQAIDLCDDVEIEISASDSSSYEITCKTEGADLPDGEDNLAYRAAQVFLEKYEINCSASIKIVKRIPIAAGLAGGSADAAAVLLALAAKCKPELSLAELANIGAGLGADVPFQIYTCAGMNHSSGYSSEAFSVALAGGIGEKLTPVVPAKKAYVLLVNPGVYISAGEAYQLFDNYGKAEGEAGAPLAEPEAGAESAELVTALEAGDEAKVLSSLSNDLMCPVAEAYPDVQELITRMTLLCERYGGAALMSGSGSTVFGLFYDREAAHKAYAEAQNIFNGMFVALSNTR